MPVLVSKSTQAFFFRHFSFKVSWWYATHFLHIHTFSSLLTYFSTISSICYVKKSRKWDETATFFFHVLKLLSIYALGYTCVESETLSSSSFQLSQSSCFFFIHIYPLMYITLFQHPKLFCLFWSANIYPFQHKHTTAATAKVRNILQHFLYLSYFTL